MQNDKNMLYEINYRNRDFYRAVQRHLVGETSLGEAVDLAIDGGAPGYYVTLAHAERRISELMNGKQLPTNKEVTELKWLEIYNRVLVEMRSRPRASWRFHLACVLDRGRATSFFMTRRQGMAIYHEEERYRKRQRRMLK